MWKFSGNAETKNLKFVWRKNFLILAARQENVFWCISYSNIHSIISVSKINICHLNSKTCEQVQSNISIADTCGYWKKCPL